MATDEEFLQGLPHLQLTWNTPLSDAHADRLLTSLQLSRGTRIVDLGCGKAELLLRALARAPELTGEGVDEDAAQLERAGTNAKARGLTGRVRFVHGDLLEYSGTADRMVCIGADHAWGGVGAALAALRSSIPVGGLLLFGCGYWARAPSPPLVEMFGALPPSFEALLSLARSSDWKVWSADSADLEEWDDFETTWRQDLDEFASREPSTALGTQALRLARQRRDEYEQGYRGVLGFAYLTLST
jgi:SAM-dependent methyltransferase